MSRPTVQTISLQDEGHKLALEQIEQVLRGDLAERNRHVERAQQAEEVARRKYSRSIERLARTIKPDLELPPGRTGIKHDLEAHTITITIDPEPAPVVKKGGKAKPKASS